MSNLVFPTFAGTGIAIKRTPVFSTVVQVAASGKELRSSYQSTPRFRYEVPLNFVRRAGFSPNTPSDEVTSVLQFFASVKGMWDSFLFTDKDSCTAALTPFGTGDGTTTAFQLLDTDGFPTYDLNGTAQIRVNGVLKTVTTDYTISATGLVTFVAAPAAAAPLTWSGGYYRRVRFDMDEYEQTQMFNQCWDGGTIKLITVK